MYEFIFIELMYFYSDCKTILKQGSKMRIFLYITLIALFLGCNAKQEEGYFDTNRTVQQALINTQKAQINAGKDKRYLVMATYLNPLNSPLVSKSHEEFIVNVYTNKKSLSSAIISGVLVDDNGEDVSWEKLKFSNELVSLTSVKNRWSNYFLVKAPLVDKKDISLTLGIGSSAQRVKLDFAKDLLK